jgi:protein transport protein SEC61 subunit alpha
MLQSALFANIFLFSQTLFHFFSNNVIVRILGVWEPIAESTQLTATGGVAYYLSAPRSISAAIFDPIHTALYLVITVITCVYLSKIWVEVSGSSPRDVAKTLKDQQLAIAGFRDASMFKELKRVISVSAPLGGAILAIVSMSGDVLGAIGSGAGILMTVMIIFQYFEMFVQEQMEVSQMMAGM